MTLRIIGSSSQGNCYLLDGAQEALIIECGCPFIEVKRALQFNLGKVVGAVVTHQHNDHAKYVPEVLGAGIRVFAVDDVFQSKKCTNNPFAVPIEHGKGYKVGGFRLQPFSVHHDVPCVGWIIQHEELGKLLFLTDTAAMGHRIAGLTHIMIEANYADDITTENVEKGYIPAVMRNRLFGSHLEIETTKRILKRQDLSKVETITLIHLSSGNSDEQRFVREVEELTGIPTRAADKGMQIPLLTAS